MNQLTVQTVLTPVDGSEASADAVEYAAAIADKYSATIHLLYVHGETITRGLNRGEVDPEDVIESQMTFLNDVARFCEDRNVRMKTSTAFGFSTTRKAQHPGSVILDVAESMDADFLVIPRERESSADVLEKAAEYVLLYASQPVLSV
ncbi:MAG: universal stress protein [Halobacteriaceae archaeon]